MSRDFQEYYDGEDCQHNLHIDPNFQSFLCPLTKEIMQDPVIIDDGRTFERAAINKWLSECNNLVEKNSIISPLSSKKLSTTSNLIPNIALCNTIKEWTRRNETARLNLARIALSPESSENDVLEALDRIQNLCMKNRNHISNKYFVRKIEVIPKIVDRLRSESRDIQCKSLQTLLVITTDDDDNKEALAAAIRTIIKFLIQEFCEEKLAAISLLHELSRSESLSEKIGEVDGSIMILIGIVNTNHSNETAIVEKATDTLNNLEKCEKNVLRMAENARFQPLLDHLLQGSSETKLQMASFLGQLVLSNDTKVLVSETVGSALINHMVNGTTHEKAAAIKALERTSSYEVSDKLLIKAGILQPLLNNILPPHPHHHSTTTTVSNKELSMALKETSANILANILGHCDNDDRMSFVSEDVISGLLHLTNNTGRAMQSKLLEIFVGLTTNSLESCQRVAEGIKSLGASINLVRFIDAPWKELQVAALKVLCNISPYIQGEIRFSLTNGSGYGTGGGYLGMLFDIVAETGGFSEEQVAAVRILAEVLPEKDSKLFRRLLHENRFLKVTLQLRRIMGREICGGAFRYSNPFLEGLVVVLLKLVLNSDCSLSFIRENNLGVLFTDLLKTSTNGSDKVLVVSAHALEHLSRKTCQLVRTNKELTGCMTTEWCRNRNRRRPTISDYCNVHSGYCLMEDDFCIVQGCVVGKLVLCLDHPNNEVVSAALGAICTLMEDDDAGSRHVDIKQAIYALIDVDGIHPIMQILLNNGKSDYYSKLLQQKAVWAVERILRVDDVSQHYINDENIIGALKHTYQHGSDVQTKHFSESALKHLDKMPVFSSIFPKSSFMTVPSV